MASAIICLTLFSHIWPFFTHLCSLGNLWAFFACCISRCGIGPCAVSAAEFSLMTGGQWEGQETKPAVAELTLGVLLLPREASQLSSANMWDHLSLFQWYFWHSNLTQALYLFTLWRVGGFPSSLSYLKPCLGNSSKAKSSFPKGKYPLQIQVLRPIPGQNALNLHLTF